LGTGRKFEKRFKQILDSVPYPAVSSNLFLHDSATAYRKSSEIVEMMGFAVNGNRQFRSAGIVYFKE